MEIPEAKGVDPLTNKIHHTLAHSYFIYFLFLILGVLLDFIFPLRIFKSTVSTLVGVLFLVLATALIFWAQRTTRNLHTHENLEEEAFFRGPYSFTRTPTHWGLFMLTLGFGIIANAFFVVVSTVLSFVISKIFFLKKYEETMGEKYGAPYLEYKKSVKL